MDMSFFLKKLLFSPLWPLFTIHKVLNLEGILAVTCSIPSQFIYDKVQIVTDLPWVTAREWQRTSCPDAQSLTFVSVLQTMLSFQYYFLKDFFIFRSFKARYYWSKWHLWCFYVLQGEAAL